METIEESVEKEGGIEGSVAADTDDAEPAGDHDYDKPFQDFRVSCKFRKIVYNYGFNKRVDQIGSTDDNADTKYYIHGIHQILRTDTKLKSRRQEREETKEL